MNDNVKSPWPGPAGMIPVTSSKADDANVFNRNYWDWYMFWSMTAFLSIILAFMNILPIPALDGGHVVFLLYEMITRRKPSEKFMVRAEYIGITLLIILMVFANLNDILRWLHIM